MSVRGWDTGQTWTRRGRRVRGSCGSVRRAADVPWSAVVLLRRQGGALVGVEQSAGFGAEQKLGGVEVEMAKRQYEPPP